MSADQRQQQPGQPGQAAAQQLQTVTASGPVTAVPSGTPADKESVYPLVLELLNPDTREDALLELSKRREVVPDLAPILWHSFGVMSTLLHEIVSIYPLLNPPTLSSQQSNRVCNALALLQCVASHNETRNLFLNGTHAPQAAPGGRGAVI